MMSLDHTSEAPRCGEDAREAMEKQQVWLGREDISSKKLDLGVYRAMGKMTFLLPCLLDLDPNYRLHIRSAFEERLVVAPTPSMPQPTMCSCSASRHLVSQKGRVFLNLMILSSIIRVRINFVTSGS